MGSGLSEPSLRPRTTAPGARWRSGRARIVAGRGPMLIAPLCFLGGGREGRFAESMDLWVSSWLS